MESSFTAAERSTQRGHPAGGYALIPVWQICRLWDFYQRGLIQFADVRLWMAAREAQERRCTLEENRTGFYTPRELERLTGHSRRVTAAGLQRLSRAGLLTFSATGISFGSSRLASIEVDSSLARVLELVKNHQRALPMPRRTLRMLAQCKRPAVVATALGHLFRCFYCRSGEVVSWGRCKASWIAETFGVDERSVKAARKHLLGLQWLVKLSGQGGSAVKRWGGEYQIHLGWKRPKSYVQEPAAHIPCMEFSPDRPIIGPEFSPCINKNPLPSEEIYNPNPEPVGETGAKALEKREKAEEGLPKAVQEPSLRHLVRADLTETGRTLDLFEQATRAKLIPASEHGRLQFVSLVEHALLHGTRNPCGLFLKLLRDKKFNFITQDDEDAARQRINRQLYQVERRRSVARDVFPVKSGVLSKKELPKEVKMALAIEHAATHKHLMPITLIRAMKLDWTLDHYHELLEAGEQSRLKALVLKNRVGESHDI